MFKKDKIKDRKPSAKTKNKTTNYKRKGVITRI